ncbi:hypothetical protein J4Q44_G00001420 [Coregonus suidteri]|uniref:Uncharacterized protein n=1 Tax=Coregonus suidteri TaxID=861788 RepID=A0AAN8MCM0_9TELE
MAVTSPTLRSTNTHRRLPRVDMPRSSTTSPPQTWPSPTLLVARIPAPLIQHPSVLAQRPTAQVLP